MFCFVFVFVFSFFVFFFVLGGGGGGGLHICRNFGDAMFVFLVPSPGIFRAKVAYMVLGSSFPSARAKHKHLHVIEIYRDRMIRP